MVKCRFVQALALIYKCLHLFVFHDDKVLYLLRELFKSCYEVSRVVCLVNLYEFWYLRLTLS